LATTNGKKYIDRITDSWFLKMKFKKELFHGVTISLYGCVTWCFMGGEDNRVNVFQNNVLSIIFRPKRESGSNKASPLLSFLGHMNPVHIATLCFKDPF
jgi:hypothetical protein